MNRFLSNEKFSSTIISENDSSPYAELHKLIKRFPYLFEQDLENELQCFLVLSSPVFRSLRVNRHLCRLVVSQYMTRKQVRHAFLANPEKRSFAFRLLPTTLCTPFEKKQVLGVLVTMFLFEGEHFDQEHLLHAVRRWIPSAHLVRGSRYVFQHPQEEGMRTLYVELDKEKDIFSLDERRVLKKRCFIELKEHVQKLLPTLFNVRNEEQIMKNIIKLSQELDDLHSLPQLIISFEKQLEGALLFTGILVYVSCQGIKSAQLLHLPDTSVTVFIERQQQVGSLQDRYSKEALVFQIKIDQTPGLIRKDLSVNMHLARKKVYSAICKAIGEVRDYEGGLILKQQELLSEFQDLFGERIQGEEELLERFFYSITPIEKQATLPLAILEILFSLIVSSQEMDLNQKGAAFVRFVDVEQGTCFFVRAEGDLLKKEIESGLSTLPDVMKALTVSTFHYQETTCFAGFLETRNPSLQAGFKKALNKALIHWKEERQAFQVLRFNCLDHPFSLDPRMGGDEGSKFILNLLFEGLMRLCIKQKPECAVAQSVSLSEDRMQYTFHLRRCFWSDGSPIQAFDFEYAWKKILSPDFNTPFAHYFYCIKNARAAKQGMLSLDQVGITVLNPFTLHVELEHPVSYFLELIAQPLFSPIHRQLDVTAPQWATTEGELYVCNGPFHLKRNQGEKGYILEKNCFYWDAPNVSISRVVFSKTNARIAFEMFKKGELDWLGRPMHRWEPLFDFARNEKTPLIYLRERVNWCVLNTRRFPFTSLKLRQALSMALNRQEFTSLYTGISPAFSPLPSHHAQFSICGTLSGEVKIAQKLFLDALQELGLTPEIFPSLVMLHPNTDYWEEVAAMTCRQWKKYLNIEVIPQRCSWPSLFEKITNGEYLIAELNWFPCVDDPLYTLTSFMFANEGLNFAKWEHPEFQHLVQQLIHEHDPLRRSSHEAYAEAILIREVPVIPLFYEKEIAIKNPRLQLSCKGGVIDFKKAKFTENLR